MYCIKHGKIENIPYVIRDMGDWYVGYILLNMDLDNYNRYLEDIGSGTHDITFNVHKDENDGWYDYEQALNNKFDVFQNKLNFDNYNTILGIDNNHYHNIEFGTRKDEINVYEQLEDIVKSIKDYKDGNI